MKSWGRWQKPTNQSRLPAGKGGAASFSRRACGFGLRRRLYGGRTIPVSGRPLGEHLIEQPLDCGRHALNEGVGSMARRFLGQQRRHIDGRPDGKRCPSRNDGKLAILNGFLDPLHRLHEPFKAGPIHQVFQGVGVNIFGKKQAIEGVARLLGLGRVLTHVGQMADQPQTNPANAFEGRAFHLLAADLLLDLANDPGREFLHSFIDRAGPGLSQHLDFLDSEQGAGEFLQPGKEVEVPLRMPAQPLFQAIEPLAKGRAGVFEDPVLDSDGMNQDGTIALLARLACHQAETFLKRPEPIVLTKPGALGKQNDGPFGLAQDAGRGANGLAVGALAQDAVAAHAVDPPAVEAIDLEQVIGHDVVEELPQPHTEGPDHQGVGPATMVAGEQNPGLLAERFLK